MTKTARELELEYHIRTLRAALEDAPHETTVIARDGTPATFYESWYRDQRGPAARADRSGPMETAHMSTDAGLKAIWQRLELYHAQRPLPSKRCRECGAFGAPASLCHDCNDQRLALKERFHKFPTPDNAARSVDEAARDRVYGVPAQPIVKRNGAVEEWLPYRDSED